MRFPDMLSFTILLILNHQLLRSDWLTLARPRFRGAAIITQQSFESSRLPRPSLRGVSTGIYLLPQHIK